MNMDKQELRQFIEYVRKAGVVLSEHAIILKFFPYLISPSANTRLQFLDQYLVDGKTLDAGAGTGWVSYWLTKRAKDVVSIDMSEDAISEFKLFFDYFNKESRKLIQVDLTKLPFKNSSFENVISFAVLEHIPNVELALLEFSRILTKEGIMIVVVPNKSGAYSLIHDRDLQKVLSKFKHKKDIRSYHEHVEGFKWWKSIIEKHGFYLIDCTNLEFLNPFFCFFLNLLGINRKHIYKLANLDNKLAKRLPKNLVTSWVLVFKKVR